MAAITMTFNSILSTSKNIIIKDVKRPVKAVLNDKFQELPGKHGSYLIPGKFKDSSIKVEIAMEEVSLAAVRSKVRELATWLHTTDWAILIFSDEPDLYWLAKCTNIEDLEQTVLVGETVIEFRVQPLAYGTEIATDFVGDTVTVDNIGSVEIYPRFLVTFTASATEWKVSNTSGQYARIVDDFVLGDVLSIDSATGAILKNGVRAMNNLDWQNSRFFALTPGDNTLSITPTGKCTCQVKFDPCYV